MADRDRAVFAAHHGRGGLLLGAVIVTKIALIVAAFFLLKEANLHVSLGVPVLLLHAGVAALLVWTLWRSIPRHRPRASTAKLQLQEGAKPSAVGILLHAAWAYDVLAGSSPSDENGRSAKPSFASPGSSLAKRSWMLAAGPEQRPYWRNGRLAATDRSRASMRQARW